VKARIAIMIGVLGASWMARAAIVEPPPSVPDEVLQRCNPEGRATWQKNYSDLVRWQQDLERSAMVYNGQIRSGATPSRKAELKAMRRSLEKGVTDYAYCLKAFQETLHDVQSDSHFEHGPSLTLVQMLNLLEHSDEAILVIYDSDKIRAVREAAWIEGCDPLVDAAFVARIEKELADIEKRWPAVTDLHDISAPHYREDAEQAKFDRVLMRDFDLGKISTYTEAQLATFVHARRDARQREITREWMRNWEEDRLHVLKIKTPGLTFEEAMKNPEVAKAYAQRIRETDAKWRTALQSARDLAFKEMLSIVDERAKRLNAGSARETWLATWNKAMDDYWPVAHMNRWEDGELAAFLKEALRENPKDQKSGDIPGVARIRELWENDVKFKARALEANWHARVNEAKATTDAFKKNWNVVESALKELWSKE
jgi:hypothetical protein